MHVHRSNRRSRGADPVALFVARRGARRRVACGGAAVVGVRNPLERGREAFARREWKDAFRRLSHSDSEAAR